MAGMEISHTALAVGGDHVTATINAAQNADAALGDANSLSTNHPDHPLRRTFVTNIRASLGDLCLRKTKGTWAPSAEAMRSILQQKKFTDLSGTAEASGDLKSIVLHSMTMSSVKSDFEIPLGVKVTGVDNTTYSLTGASYSHICAPMTESNTARTLQKDDVSLAYEFARKFPGYTSQNIAEKGVHEVQARRFCLIASDHPIVSAIQENADKLQMGDISMMPEGLVKIGTDLYKTILPMVRSQVESQIKVRDLSATKLSIEPADSTSWSDVRTELIAEHKALLRSELETELAAAPDEAAVELLRTGFSRKERLIEHQIDSRIHNFSATIDIEYNFLSK